MIDWVTISLALAITATLVGIFGFMAWKINMPDPLITVNLTGKKDETNQLLDSDKKQKKKRKEHKKSKRDNKEDDDHRRHSVTFKEPSIQTSEETDNEREESEQESSTPQVVETPSKVRHRNRKKARPTTPSSSDHIEGILINKDEKSPVTTRAEPIPHPKLAIMTPKDEVELARQHHQQTKAQGKSTQGSNKQTVPPSPPLPVTAKKSAPASSNANQGGQKQQQQQQQLLQEQQEQPFTTVVGNRHKAGTPPSQQQNKSANVTTPSSVTSTAASPVPAPLPQQQAPVQSQHEQLPQRQAPPRQQKEKPAQLNGFNTNSQPVKQSAVVSSAAAPPTKIADLVKALPTSQAVVTELMSGLDAFPLSTDELDIIMHKIANKQSVIKQDWSKLQHGQKVDPQAHIGQVLDESARAFEEDMKTNAMKRIRELTDERNNDKHRINELLKETNDKDLNIQVLHAQLSTIQHPQQQMQTFQIEFKRLSEENMQLKQRLAQQQHFQQQQLSSMNLVPNNGPDPANAQLRVISEQIKKLSVDNGNLEKQLKAKELLLKEGQKERDDLLRTNQQLLQKAQENQKQLQLKEDKLLKELTETRTLNNNQLNDYQRRIEQLEKENEQLRRIEVAQVETTPVINNQDREKIEQLIKENEQYKIKQNQFQIQENQLKQEFEQLKSKSETLNNQLTAANGQLDTLRAELELAKSNNDSANAQVEQQKQKQFLLELLQEDVRNQLPNDTQDFNQWLSAYRQILTSSIESNKRALQDESVALKLENDRLLKNMTEVENQLKEIEQTVQSKEESLLADLKSKDAILDNIHGENDQLNGELQRLRTEIERLQLAHNIAVNDNRALKLQLDERHLVNANSSSITAGDPYEFVKPPSPYSAEIDLRAEKLNELIGSTKEVIENQDSIVQQLDKYIDQMHRSGTGGISNVDDSTVSSASSDQQQSQS